MTEKTATKKTRIGFVSLGCPKNLVDSEVMLGTLDERGYEITKDQQSADVIVVNTCGFIDSAKQESIDTILEMAQFKEAGNCRKLVVAGCLGERYRSEIQKEIPEIDYVFGPDELGKILEAVRLDGDTTPSPNLSIDALYTSLEVPTIPRILTTPSHMAYLKISEGCDHTCAFCAIPGFRGSFRSRNVADLVAEARRLADGGVRELVIVSQDTLAFGKDLGIERGTIRLLEGLLGVDGLRWIRLLYCYPNLLSDELVEMIGNQDRLCSYFDIPYQHASPRIMERMRRGGGREMFHRQVESVRDRVPEAGLRTSFIVGFPGETPEDFDDLLGFVEDVRFDNLGVFLYSDEDGTSAYNLDGKVDRDTAIERRDLLMQRQAVITGERLEGMVGRKMTVLLDGLSSETDLLLEGRLETQAPEIDGHVLINDANGIEPSAGRFYKVEMTERLEYDLIGRIVEEI